MAIDEKKQNALDLYAAVMGEIKVRIAAIDAGTGGALTALPAPIVQEHCYLQLRMCCELISLGCLVAHGDITSAGMQKVWSAEKILASLEALHSDFFPKAVVVQKMPNFHHMEPQANTISKSDLLVIYAKCGDRLHRGNLKKLMAQGKIPIQVNYPEITSYAQQIVDLLSNHVVALSGGNEVILCSMNSGDTNQVTVAAASRAQPPPHIQEAMNSQ